MKIKKYDCPVCGELSVSEVDDHVYKFKHGKKSHMLQGLFRSVCGACGVSFFTPDQLDRNNKKVREFQDKLSDYISPTKILELREKYDITQLQANVIFGGGPTAFSKYERGIASPTAGTARQMLAALKDVKVMEVLAGIHNIKIAQIDKPVKAKEKIIYTLPESLRSSVELYASRVRLPIQESCAALISRGINSLEPSGVEEHVVASGFSRLVHMNYGVHGYKLSPHSQEVEVIRRANRKPELVKMKVRTK